MKIKVTPVNLQTSDIFSTKLTADKLMVGFRKESVIKCAAVKDEFILNLFNTTLPIIAGDQVKASNKKGQKLC